MSSNPFDTGAIGGAGFAAFTPPGQVNALSSDEPAWKQAFRATLDEIHEKGFRTYADDLNKKKLEEMRKKILESMGLTEEALKKLSPEGQASIEKMITEEIRKRLTAEAALDNPGNSRENSKADAKAQGGVGQSETLEAQTAPNGFGPGFTLIQAMESRSESDPRNLEKERQ